MTDSINWCNLKKNAKHIGEVSTSRADGSPTGVEILTSTDEVTGQTRDTLAGKFKKMDDAFNSITSSQFIVTNFGNWSNVAGQQIEEADRLKGYMHQDDSGNVYAVKGSVALPITRPSSPIGDDRFYLASAVNVEKMRSESASQLGLVYQSEWAPNITIPANSKTDKYCWWYGDKGVFITPVSDAGFTTGATFNVDNWVLSELLTKSDLKKMGYINAWGVTSASDRVVITNTIEEMVNNGVRTVIFTDGNYSGFDNFWSDMTFIFSAGAKFSDTVHLAISGRGSVLTQNIRAIGMITTADRVGTYDCKNVVVDAIHQTDGNRGVHIYFNSQDVEIGYILVEGIANTDTESNKCVKIDGTVGKLPSRNIKIGAVIADASKSGALAAVSIESDTSEVSSVTIDSIVAVNCDYDLFLLGDETTENGIEINSLKSNGGSYDAVYQSKTNGVTVNKIKSKNKGGCGIRHAGAVSNTNIGIAKFKNIGTNAALASGRRVALSVNNPMGLIIDNLDVDGVDNNDALLINNETGALIEINRLSIKNTNLRCVVPTDSFKNIKIGTLILESTSDCIKSISSSVIANVSIEKLIAKSSSGDCLNLENTTIANLVIDAIDARNGCVNAVSIKNVTNDASGVLIKELAAENCSNSALYLESQDEGITVNNLLVSNNLYGIRAINAHDININIGLITSNTNGLSNSRCSGWLVNGLRVTGNNNNGSLPSGTVGSNIIDA